MTLVQTQLPFGPATTPPPQTSLPVPSDEQRAVVERLVAGECVLCQALAGTGKTTTCLMAVAKLHEQGLSERAVICTFNKPLQLECEIRIAANGLVNCARAYTFHALFGRDLPFDAKINDNIRLQQRLKRWRAGTDLPPRIAADFVIIDETQDMCPLYYEALTYVLPFGALFLVVGDVHQLLYGYKLGDERASSCYLVQASRYFGRFAGGRTWAVRALTISYRLTPHVACVVNTVWGTDIKAGNTDPRANVPVEYWYADLYDVVTLGRKIARLIDNVGMGNVYILSQSVRDGESARTPLTMLINHLQDRKVYRDVFGKRLYNFHKSYEKGSAENKVRVWTFCATKGTEASTVIVFGLDVYNASRPVAVNEMGVALSRSSGRLIIVHGRGTEKHPRTYHPALPYEKVVELARKGVLKVWPQMPPVMAVAGFDVAGTRNVADIVPHLPASGVLALLEGLEWTRCRVDDAGELVVTATKTFHTGSCATTESLHALYGVAVPFALEDRRTGRIGAVDEIISPLPFDANRKYCWQTFEELVIQAGVEADVVSRMFDDFVRQGDGRTVTGKRLIEMLRRRRPTAHGRRLGVIDRATYDAAFEGHLGTIRESYGKKQKTSADYMLLANARQAYGRSHHLLHQMGSDVADYAAWVEAPAFETALARLDTMVCAGVSFDSTCAHRLPTEVVFSGQTCEAIGAVLDAEGDAVVHTNHFGLSPPSATQKAHALLGASVVASDRGRPVRCVINDYRRGEQYSVALSLEKARTCLRTLVDVMQS